LNEKDYTTHNFIQRYVSEQIEEEALARTINDKLKMIGADKGGLYLFDRDLGTNGCGATCKRVIISKMISNKKQFTCYVLTLFLSVALSTQYSYSQELDLGSVDSFYYLTDSSGAPVKQLDTTYYPNGEIGMTGRLILKKDSTKSDLRYGVWITYNGIGVVVRQGNFAVAGRWFCSSGPVWHYYIYKVGEWVYNYNSFTARGLYTVKTKNVRAGGRKSETQCSYINKSWIIRNTAGDNIKPTKKIKRELNWIGC
jgi:hypothetical protein